MPVRIDTLKEIVRIDVEGHLHARESAGVGPDRAGRIKHMAQTPAVGRADKDLKTLPILDAFDRCSLGWVDDHRPVVGTML